MIKVIINHYLRDVLDRMNDLETVVRVMLTSPEYLPIEAAGLNGSVNRKQIFAELLRTYNFSCILETGTYLGDSAGYFAQTAGIPVHSAEINPLLHSLARSRLRHVQPITLHNCDSRAFLRDMASRRDLTEGECFFYLDAHWGSDYPLPEEVALIASHWRRFVVMVDDFQVPGDDGYAFDRCGLFKRMNLALIGDSLRRHNLTAYFPSLPGREDTTPGNPKGFVILSDSGEYGSRLQSLPLLRMHSPLRNARSGG
jgi:hypothetical protein